MVVTWSDSDDSMSDEKNQEVVNLCLMIQEEEVTSELLLDFIFEELQNAFCELLDEFKKISKKNKDLKKMCMLNKRKK